jgi:hypothetical protein
MILSARKSEDRIRLTALPKPIFNLRLPIYDLRDSADGEWIRKSHIVNPK